MRKAQALPKQYLGFFSRSLQLLCKNLISRRAFAVLWEIDAYEHSSCWGHVNLTDVAGGAVIFFDTRACSHENRRHGGIIVASCCGHGVAMVIAVVVMDTEDNVSSFWSAHAQKHSVLVVQRKGNDAVSGLRIFVTVQIGNDPFL